MEQERAFLPHGEPRGADPRDVEGGGEAHHDLFPGLRALDAVLDLDDRFLPLGVVLADTCAMRRRPPRPPRQLGRPHLFHAARDHHRRFLNVRLQIRVVHLEPGPRHRCLLVRHHHRGMPRLVADFPYRHPLPEDPAGRVESRLASRFQRAGLRGLHGDRIARTQGDRRRLLEHLIHVHHHRPVRGGDLGHRDGADLGDGADENDVGLLHERRPAHLAERRGSRQGQEDREEHRRPSVHGTPPTATLCRHGRTGTLKKNGSIETATVAPDPSSSRCVAKSTRR